MDVPPLIRLEVVVEQTPSKHKHLRCGGLDEEEERKEKNMVVVELVEELMIQKEEEPADGGGGAVMAMMLTLMKLRVMCAMSERKR